MKASSEQERDTPNDLATEAKRAISTALNTLLADTFALYVKTKKRRAERDRLALERPREPDGSQHVSWQARSCRFLKRNERKDYS